MAILLSLFSRRCIKITAALPLQLRYGLLICSVALSTFYMTLLWVNWGPPPSSTLYPIYLDNYPKELMSLANAVGSSVEQPSPVSTGTLGVVDGTYNGDFIPINWSDFAYLQYATDKTYLCNSLMIFEQLHTLKTRPRKVLIYPIEWGIPGYEALTTESGDIDPSEQYLLQKARDDYGVELRPVPVISLESDQEYWASSFTKLQIFNMTDYKRVLVMDSDSTVHKSLDYLFLAPQTTLAAPRSYWNQVIYGERIVLTSLLMLIEPSEQQAKRVVKAMETRGNNDYDMEIINDLYKNDCLILPHRGLTMLSGDLRRQTHRQYMGSSTDTWNSTKELENTALVHFSDYPYPKVG